MTEYAKARKKARSPLGAFIAAFLDPEQANRPRAIELFGEERADKLLRLLSRARIREGGKLGSDYHDDDADHVGRVLAYLCMVLEHANPDSGRACTRKLYQGRTRRWDSEQKRVVYVPGEQAGGLAARLGVCPRTIQEYGALLHDHSILQRWQIRTQDEVNKLPRIMRGKRFSYALFRWVGDVPREVRRAIREWWGAREPKHAQQPTAVAPQGPRAGNVPARVAELVAGVLGPHERPPSPSS